MISAIINQYDFNLLYIKELVKDLSEEQMTYSPGPGFENHPAFTIGHLVTGSAMMIEELGGEYVVPAGWDDLFLRKGPGDPRYPESDVTKYPDKKTLLDELERQHISLKDFLLKKDPAELKHELVEWRFDRFMPSMLDLVTFMCTTHESLHIGQLGAWRRAQGLDSALAKIR